MNNITLDSPSLANKLAYIAASNHIKAVEEEAKNTSDNSQESSLTHSGQPASVFSLIYAVHPSDCDTHVSLIGPTVFASKEAAMRALWEYVRKNIWLEEFMESAGDFGITDLDEHTTGAILTSRLASIPFTSIGVIIDWHFKLVNDDECVEAFYQITRHELPLMAHQLPATFSLGCYGIEITWDGVNRDAAAIRSDLRDESLGESDPFNSAIDAIESLILAQFCSGFDLTSPAYLESIETTISAIEQKHGSHL